MQPRHLEFKKKKDEIPSWLFIQCNKADYPEAPCYKEAQAV